MSEHLDIHGSDKFFTIPTVGMTLPRAALGLVIPVLAYKGKNTGLITALGALSDKETPVADFVDRLKPEWGLGRSIPGADADYKADYAFGAGSVFAAFLDKRSDPIHYAAAAINTAKFASQGIWAVKANRLHTEITGEPLKTKVGMTGKVATFLAMTSAAANTVSREMKPKNSKQELIKTGLGWIAVSTALGGLVFGEVAKHQNDKQFRQNVGLLIK